MKEKNKKRSWKQIVSILSCIVVFCTTYALILPAVTLSTDTFCGKEEHTHNADCYIEQDKSKPLCGLEEGEGSEGHTHTEDCYGNVEVGRNLICGMEEVEGHVHDDSCYQSEFEYGLICGKEESEPTEGHVHNEDCYKSEEPICGKEEHTHSHECYSNKEDVEDPKDWEEAYKDINKEEDAKKRILQVAKNEVGYKENEANFSVDENDAEHYYTRYGHLYEDMYGDWNNYFTGYVLKYANVKMNFDKDISKWQNKTIDDQKEEGEEGNVVFFRDDEGELRSGIVTKIDSLTKEIRVIEGDVDGQVKEERVNKDKVIAYLSDEVTIEDEDTPLAGGDEFKNSKTYEDDKISVKVSYNDDAGIPEDAELVVKEITEESDPEHYNARKQEYLELMGESDDTDAVDEASEEVADESAEEPQQKEEDQIFLLHDISFQVDGEEIEPKTEVKVEIIYKDEKMQDVDSDSLQIVHFKDDDTKEKVEPDKVEKKETDLKTNFKLESFSNVMVVAGTSTRAAVSSIDTVTGTPVSGVSVKMFNYGSSINNNSLKFIHRNFPKNDKNYIINNGKRIDVSVDGIYGVDSSYKYNYSARQLKSKPTLSSTGYPIVDAPAISSEDNHNAGDIPGLNDYSLEYLFSESYFKGEAKNGGGLFQEGSDGYYYYDSRVNAAYFNEISKEFTLYDATIGMPYVADNGRGKNFLPFNNLEAQKNYLETGSNGDNNGSIQFKQASTSAKLVDLWFGMEIEFTFLMPKEESTEDLVFDFRGDDDVFVYVDDQLVIDLGGCHKALGATVNFTNGTITHDDGANGIGGKNFTNIYGANNVSTKGGFKEYTKHTLKMFYLERGGGLSNCMIRFNLPTLPENSLTVSKEVTDNATSPETKDYFANLLDYQFKVVPEGESSSYFDFGTQYTVYEKNEDGTANLSKPVDGIDSDGKPKTRSLPANGIFTLKANQAAVFENVMSLVEDTGNNGKNFVVQEWLPTDQVEAYENVTLSGNGGTIIKKEEDGTGEGQSFTSFTTGSLKHDDTHVVQFQNQIDIAQLSLIKVKKEMDVAPSNLDETFKFEVKIEDQLLPKGTNYTVTDANNTITKTVEENGIIELKANETATITKYIIAGTDVKVREIQDKEFNNRYNVPTYQYTIGDSGELKDWHPDAGITVGVGQNLTVITKNTFKNNIINQFKIKKVAAGTEDVLDGAEFTLYQKAAQGTTGAQAIKFGNNTVYGILLEQQIEAGEIIVNQEIVSGNQYYLVETKAPNGYYVSETPILIDYIGDKIVIYGKIDGNGNGITDPDSSIETELKGNVLSFNIENNPGKPLPNTGGAGTKLFTFSGAAVIAASGLMYGYKKKKDKRNGKGGLRK